MGAVLSLTGWQPLDETTLDMFRRHPRLIVVFSHTSYGDFFYYLSYLFSHPMMTSRCKALINPYWMDRYGWLLRTVGGVTATRRQDSQGGALQRIAPELQNMKEFILLISPKGSMDANRWRSGYYYLAQQLDASIMCAGFDYHRHRFTAIEPFGVKGMTLAEVELRCKRSMRSIATMYPVWSEFPLDTHTAPLETSVISDYRMATIVAVLVVVLLLLVWLVVRGGESTQRQ